jgi:hypothetical protein
MLDLLQDWGAFLEVGLYQEALVHFLGGASNVERRVSLHRLRLDLGGQRMIMHAPGVAFRLTAFADNQSHFEVATAPPAGFNRPQGNPMDQPQSLPKLNLPPSKNRQGNRSARE